MAEGAREPAPPTRRGQVDGENSLPVQREHTVQPCGQHSGKRRVTVPLAYDSPLHLAGGHRAGCGGEPAGRVLGCPVLPARGRPERRLRSGRAPHGRRRRACDGRGSENGVRSARPGGVRLSQPSLNSRARGARAWCEATGVDRARSSRNSIAVAGGADVSGPAGPGVCRARRDRHCRLPVDGDIAAHDFDQIAADVDAAQGRFIPYRMAACRYTNRCFALSTLPELATSWSAEWRRSCTATHVWRSLD